MLLHNGRSSICRWFLQHVGFNIGWYLCFFHKYSCKGVGLASHCMSVNWLYLLIGHVLLYFFVCVVLNSVHQTFLIIFLLPWISWVSVSSGFFMFNWSYQSLVLFNVHSMHLSTSVPLFYQIQNINLAGVFF